jgi:hypothetical protein
MTSKYSAWQALYSGVLFFNSPFQIFVICFWPLCVQHPVHMADVAVGDTTFLLSHLKTLFYQKQIIQGCSPDQAWQSDHPSIYDILWLCKIIPFPTITWPGLSQIRWCRGKRTVDIGENKEKSFFTFTTHFAHWSIALDQTRHSTLLSHRPTNSETICTTFL